MKNLLTIILIFIAGFSLNAQTGPGGIGNNTNNIVWLDASRLGLTDGAAVSSWTDFSGNNNHAAQGSGTLQPTFRTNQLNTSLPAIDFDGTDDYLDFGTNITTQGASIFFIFNENGTKNWHGVVALDSVLCLARQFTYNVDHNAGSVLTNKIARGSGYTIFSMATGSSSTNDNVTMTQAGNTATFTRTDLYDGAGTSSIGRRAVGNAYHMNANVPEVIIYNEKLDSASRNIILNYLGAKYNLTPPNSGLYSYGSTHSNDVMGIGQESDGSNTTAQGTDSLIISTPSSMGNGDYIMVGNDGGSFAGSASVPSGISERWTRVWRADVTGTPGTISVEFDLDGGGLGAVDNYVVLVDDDGDFSNGGTTTHSTGRSYSAGSNSISFTGLSLSDGDYFTLAEQDGDVDAVMDGLWRAPATWSCGCIPGSGDIVTIGNTFDVTVDSNAHALNLTINAGGSINFTGSDTLTMLGPLSIGGTFTAGTATLAAAAAVDQDFSNSSGGTLALNNLYVNNTTGLDLVSGEWSISGNLQVSAGNLDVSGATSMTLISDATKTSQILESVDNAFVGDFTVQRYIGARNANYGNLSSPMEISTPADLDDDLFISGIGGMDGNATVAGGGIFYSMKTYNNVDAKHDTISSTTHQFSPGNGFEIYLASTLSTFNATTIDYVGIPTSGDFVPNQAVARQFWNLLGNPYHAYVQWDSIEKLSFIPDDYYIFNTDNGSYDFFTGVKSPLAPHQGFWVHKPIFGGNSIIYKEEDKVDGNTSTFIRKKNKQELTFRISSDLNPFKHQMQFHFSPNVENSMDDKDAPYLPSPLEEAPAIFSKAINSKEKLIRNSLNSYEETQLVPISVYTGLEGEYTVSSIGSETIYDNYSCAYLKDNETNEVIDLLVEDSYSFTAKKGTNERFNLILSNSYNECQKLIDDGVYEQNLDTKLSLRNANGQWFLDYTLGEENTNLEIRILNMAGQEVRTPFPFSASRAGSLMIDQLDGLSGIYLIQVKSENEIINKTVKL